MKSLFVALSMFVSTSALAVETPRFYCSDDEPTGDSSYTVTLASSTFGADFDLAHVSLTTITGSKRVASLHCEAEVRLNGPTDVPFVSNCSEVDLVDDGYFARFVSAPFLPVAEYDSLELYKVTRRGYELVASLTCHQAESLF